MIALPDDVADDEDAVDPPSAGDVLAVWLRYTVPIALATVLPLAFKGLLG